MAWIFLLFFSLSSEAGYVRSCQDLFSQNFSVLLWRQELIKNYRLNGITYDHNSDIAFQKVEPQLQRLTKAQLKQLAYDIQRRYGAVHEQSQSFEVKMFRRVLDFIIVQIVNPSEIFTKELEKTKSPLMAWQKAMDAISEFIGLEDPFSAVEILEMGQRFLANMTSHKEVSFDSVKQSAFYLFGSIPNGRALRFQSDLDIYTINIKQQLYFRRIDEPRLRSFLQVDHVSSSLYLHSFVNYSALLSPFMLEVGPSEIRLIVYPSLKYADVEKSQQIPLKYYSLSKQKTQLNAPVPIWD